jgi:hypothetical protein
MGALATAFASNAAFMADDPNLNYDEKNRSVAMALSKIPGVGQFYLNERKRAVMFLSVYPVCMALFIMIYEFRSDVLYLLGNFIAVVFFSGIASKIDVERACNRRGMPYVNIAREPRIKNYRNAYMALTKVATGPST